MSTSISTGSEVVFPLYCQPCNGEGKHLEAVGYCADCLEHLCSTCFTSHLVPTLTKHHRLQDGSEMPRQMKDKSSANMFTDVCPSHPNKMIEYFCRWHNHLGCSVCTTLHHRSCDNIDYIPDVADKVGDSEELKDLRWKLEVLCNTVEKIKSVSQENKIAAESCRKEVKTEIRKLIHFFTALMTKLEKDIDLKVDSIAEQDLQLMDNSVQECDAMVAEVGDLTKELAGSKQTTVEQNCQLFIAMKRSEETVRHLEKKTESLSSKNMIKRYNFTPDKRWREMIAASPDIGTINVWESSNLTATHVLDIDVNLHVTDENGIVGGVLVNETYLVVCNYSTYAVKLIDVVQNKTISTVSVISEPIGITEVNDGKLLVALPFVSKLHFLSLTGGKLQDTGHSISVDGQCCNVVSTQHYLIVSFMESFKIEILDINGTVLRRFVYSADIPYKTEFIFLTLSPCQDIIYISSPYSGKVISLTLNGKVLHTYTDVKLKFAAGVVADMYGNVFVCGFGSNNVHVLTFDLKKIKIMIEGDGVDGPSFICTNKSANKLFINMERSGKIKVYNVSRSLNV